MADQRRRRAPDPPDPDDPTRLEDPTSLDQALAKLVAKRGWGTRLEAAAVHARWEDIAGPQLARHCRPVRLAGGVLVVAVSSSAWAEQVRYLAGDLVQRANAVLGDGFVERVTVTIGK